jgi:hypothetical protein
VDFVRGLWASGPTFGQTLTRSLPPYSFVAPSVLLRLSLISRTDAKKEEYPVLPYSNR